MKKYSILFLLAFLLVLLFSGCYTNMNILEDANENFKNIGEDINNALEDLEKDFSSSFEENGEDEGSPVEDDGNHENSLESVVWSALEGQRLANFSSEAYDGGIKFPRYGKPDSYEGQCTWYCFGRAIEKLEKTIIFEEYKGSGMAGEWLDSVTNYKTTTDKNAICSDCIAVSDIHVVYVEFVQNGKVYYTEANWSSPVDNKLDETDGLLKSDSVDDFIEDRNIKGYVYLK